MLACPSSYVKPDSASVVHGYSTMHDGKQSLFRMGAKGIGRWQVQIMGEKSTDSKYRRWFQEMLLSVAKMGGHRERGVLGPGSAFRRWILLRRLYVLIGMIQKRVTTGGD